MSNLTNNEAQECIRASMEPVLGKVGITREYLAKELKRELNAKETKVFHNKDTGVIYSKKMIAWTIRQKAREDAQKLLGLYPAEKREITFHEGITVDDISQEQKELKQLAILRAKVAVEEKNEKST